MVHITVSHCTLPYYDWATELHRMTDVLVLLSQEKLHKLEHALVESKDDKAAEKAEAERQRDREAEEKLKYLQCEFLCVCVCVYVSHHGEVIVFECMADCERMLLSSFRIREVMHI